MGYSYLKELAACLPAATEFLDDGNHIAALGYRQQVTKAWNIHPGASVLGIGPGQGDFTVVLADVVGPTGHVGANASLESGTPNYRSAQAYVVASAVGHQVSVVRADPIAYLLKGAGGWTFDFTHSPTSSQRYSERPVNMHTESLSPSIVVSASRLSQMSRIRPPKYLP